MNKKTMGLLLIQQQYRIVSLFQLNQYTGLVEIMRQSYIAAGSTRDPLFFYSFAAVLYLLLTFVSMKLINRLEVRYSRGY